MAKRYFWLKLKDDFFNQREIKKLRKIAGGDTYTIIYLKLQLLSLKNEGALFFEGIEDNFIDEMALELDEEVDNVKITLLFLEKHNLIEMVSDEKYILPKILECIGSESESAERVRRYRDNKKSLHCNVDVTDCNVLVTKCNTDIEKDIEKDIKKDIEKDIEKDIKKENTSLSKKFSDESIEIILSKKLFDFIKKHNSTNKEPNLQSWAKQIDLMLRVDKRTEHEISEMIGWCQNDTFWQSNILSTKKLREKYDQMYIKMNYRDDKKVINNIPQHINFEQRNYADKDYSKYISNA